MSAFSFASAIALATAMAAGAGVTAAHAQRTAIPAEFPPSSYQGNQYVDSKGCAFIRAGMDGAVNWVPRVDRARNQLCNFKPTTTRTAAAPVPDPLPDVPIITVKATPAPATAPVPAAPQRVRAAAAPKPRVAAAPAPAPAPQRTRVAATPRVVAAPKPRRITLAEACEGRFGVQPGFVSAQTGKAIDCGASPAPAAVATRSAAQPAPLRLTLAAACAHQIETGIRLIDSATGQPIACTPAAPVRIAAAAPAPVIPAPRTVPAPLAVPAQSTCAVGNLQASNRYAVRCGPQTQSPSGVQNARRSTAATAASISTRTAKAARSSQVPASNGGSNVAVVPKGYARVWDDGRINPQRGLPKAQVVARVSTRTVAPAVPSTPAASSKRYVQVGSFADPANAARLIARLQAAGMPVASAKSGGTKTIAAGPFRSASDLNRALGIVRGMGFSDAFLRS